MSRGVWTVGPGAWKFGPCRRVAFGPYRPARGNADRAAARRLDRRARRVEIRTVPPRGVWTVRPGAWKFGPCRRVAFGPYGPARGNADRAAAWRLDRTARRVEIRTVPPRGVWTVGHGAWKFGPCRRAAFGPYGPARGNSDRAAARRLDRRARRVEIGPCRRVAFGPYGPPRGVWTVRPAARKFRLCRRAEFGLAVGTPHNVGRIIDPPCVKAGGVPDGPRPRTMNQQQKDPNASPASRR
jgi:hypothetical protein